MKKTINFISEFNDFELANFAKFKMESYMIETQDVIKEYLKKREITEDRIEILIAENLKRKIIDNKERCPKCFSDKLRIEKVEWTKTIDKFSGDDEIASLDGTIGKVTYIDEVECNVCGFILKDPNQKNYKKRTITQKISDYILSMLNAIIN
jgi:hypothetical protein